VRVGDSQVHPPKVTVGRTGSSLSAHLLVTSKRGRNRKLFPSFSQLIGKANNPFIGVPIDSLRLPGLRQGCDFER
jgi:hypothetical protein